MKGDDNIPFQEEIELERNLKMLLPTCTYMQSGKYVIAKVISVEYPITFENTDMKDHPKEHYNFSGIFRLKMYNNEDDKKNEEDKKNDDKGRMPGMDAMYYFRGVLFENKRDKSIIITNPIIIQRHL